MANRDEPRLEVPPQVEELLDEAREPGTPHCSSRSLSDDELVEALRVEGWNVTRAAVRLNGSRTVLNKRMDKCPRIRKAADIGRVEIEDARERYEGIIDSMAAYLEVSPHGLQLRMKALGLPNSTCSG